VRICGVCQFPNRPAASVVLTEYPIRWDPELGVSGIPVQTGPDIPVCTRCIGQTLNVLGAAGVIVGSVVAVPTEGGAETPG